MYLHDTPKDTINQIMLYIQFGFIILYSNFIYFIFKSIFLLYIKNTNSKNIFFSFSRLKCILMVYQKVPSIILCHIYTSNFIILYLSLYLVSIYFYFYLTFFITKALYIYIFVNIFNKPNFMVH